MKRSFLMVATLVVGMSNQVFAHELVCRDEKAQVEYQVSHSASKGEAVFNILKDPHGVAHTLNTPFKPDNRGVWNGLVTTARGRPLLIEARVTQPIGSLKENQAVSLEIHTYTPDKKLLAQEVHQCVVTHLDK